MKKYFISAILMVALLLIGSVGIVLAVDSIDTRTRITNQVYSEAWRGVSPVDVQIAPNQPFKLAQAVITIGEAFDNCQATNMACTISDTGEGEQGTMTGTLCVEIAFGEGEGGKEYVTRAYVYITHTVPNPTEAYITGSGGEHISFETAKSPIVAEIPAEYLLLIGSQSVVVIANADYPDGALIADLPDCEPTEGEGAGEGEGAYELSLTLDSALGQQFDAELFAVPATTGTYVINGGLMNILPNTGSLYVDIPEIFKAGDALRLQWPDTTNRPLSVDFTWIQP